MADSTISALTAAAVLDGTEALPIAQATSTVRTTTQAVANLASATSAKINTVSNALSNLISLHDVLSNRVSANSAVGGGSVTSAEVQTASAAATSADAHANAASAALSLAVSALQTSIQTASAAVTSVDARVNTISNTLSAVSALSVGVAANGLQSAMNALSNTISSVSAAVTSVDTRVNTVSNIVSQHTVSLAALSNLISSVSSHTSIGGATSTKGLQSALNNLSLQISSLNSVVSNALSAGDVISANFVSVQSTVSHLASIVSLVSTVSAAGVAVGLQSCINAISNRISILSNSISAVSTVSTTGTAVGLQSVVDALSNRLSYFVTPPNAITTNAPITRRVLSAPSTVVASAALADISGLSVSVKNGGIYQFFSYLMLTRGGAATVHGFGITFPAMTACRGSMETHVSVSQSVLVANNCYETYFDQTGSGSILISVSASQGARLPTFLKAEGLLVPSANGVVQMQAKAAGGTSALSVLTGSYIEVRRIN